MLVKLVVAVTLVGTAISYPQYRDRIPNGYNVVSPCDGSAWSGVGHVIQAGGGDRNDFGMDFAAEGHQWTVTLCQKDSDGDGVLNGVELGDANCNWTMANPNAVDAVTGHPGICEPVGSAACASSWFACP